jgi:hypothetical protein
LSDWLPKVCTSPTHSSVLAWFSLTNLLFGMWLLSAVSLSDTFDMLWCSHNVSSRGITSSQSNPLPSWSTQ